MKKIINKQPIDDFELLPEYRFDYTKAKPNRFAKNLSSRKLVLLDPDIAKIFPNGKSVNDTLRALVKIFPKQPTQRKVSVR